MRGLAVLLLVCAAASCGEDHSRTQLAKTLIADHCAACHRVPGVAVAQGRVGPSLAHIGQQQMIAGYFANTPDMLTRWIENPQALLPGNAMPTMGLSHDQAAAIADYLYTMD